MSSILTQPRLSGADLHLLTEEISSSILSTTTLLQGFESRLLAAQEHHRHLEAARIELEAQLARTVQDLSSTALEIGESERGMVDCEERLRILRVVEGEMEDTKERALEELKISAAKIPPEVSGLFCMDGLL